MVERRSREIESGQLLFSFLQHARLFFSIKLSLYYARSNKHVNNGITLSMCTIPFH